MASRKRRWVLLVAAGIAVIAIVVLAAGFSELELLLGEPYSLPEREATPAAGGPVKPSPGLPEIGPFLNTLILVALLLLLPLGIIYLIVSREGRKRVLAYLSALLWLLALYLLVRRGLRFPTLVQEEGLLTPGATPVAASEPPVAELPDFVVNPPRGFDLAVSLGLVALVVVAGWLVWRRLRRPPDARALLALEAQDALEELRAGADLEDTVMRCYYEMGRVLSRQLSIEREEAMTPREFESYLEELGLPGEHIRRLTRLFEEVRYGAKAPGEQGEREAVACLTAIVEVCGGSA